MKKMPVFISLLLSCILFLQCAEDPVQNDLLNYINVELPKVAQLETDAINAYSSVTGSNYTDDKTTYDKITNVVLPKYTEFNKKLKTIKPATSEVKKIHAEYVKAAGDQLEAFKYIVDAIKRNNSAEITKANKDMELGRNLIAKWKSDLLETCKKHNVVLNGNE